MKTARACLPRAIGFALLACATPSLAGPFGVEMGAPISSLPGAKPTKTVGPVTIYSAPTVPKPNSEFESYTVTASDKTGVCKISGLGKDHNGDPSGVDIRAVYDAFSNILTEKYGPSKDYDFLHKGALWQESHEFAMALAKKERTLVRFWSPEFKSNLPNDVTNISLEVSALDSSTTYISLRYELANFETCSTMIKSSDNSGL